MFIGIKIVIYNIGHQYFMIKKPDINYSSVFTGARQQKVGSCDKTSYKNSYGYNYDIWVLTITKSIHMC